MSSRQELALRKAALLDDLRRVQSEGHVPPGSAAQSQRSLATQYGLSLGVVGQLLGTLISEGVLYTVPRLGTFVGTPPNQFDVYLLTFGYLPGANEFFSHIQLGFEERVAQLGGASLRLTEAQARDDYHRGKLPPLAGMFRMGTEVSGADWWPERLPLVEFGVPLRPDATSDRIRFDDLSGGRQAARHLLGMGHQKIAFLAMHTREHFPGEFFWSIERERGWAQALNAAGVPPAGLAFHLEAGAQPGFRWELSGDEQLEAARKVAAVHLVNRRDITAIVAANSIAAEGLFKALDEAGIPPASRPAVLCFDDDAAVTRSIVSYLRLPWDEVGRVGAQLLWERHRGPAGGPAQQRLVPMRLIPRLSCRPELAAPGSVGRVPRTRKAREAPAARAPVAEVGSVPSLDGAPPAAIKEPG